MSVQHTYTCLKINTQTPSTRYLSAYQARGMYYTPRSDCWADRPADESMRAMLDLGLILGLDLGLDLDLRVVESTPMMGESLGCSQPLKNCATQFNMPIIIMQFAVL